MARKWRTERGQSAVETMFSIPIFLMLSAIGFELFAITWNAQYAHVTSRYNAIHQADHKPCNSNNDGADKISSITAQSDSSTVTGDQTPYMRAFGKQRNIQNTAYIVCK